MTDCSNKMANQFKIFRNEENCNDLTKQCELAECVFMVNCKLYISAISALECDEDTHYKYESINACRKISI